MEAILQNKIRQKLNQILPSLSRFAMVLTGDEDSGDGLLAVFCARVIFTDILDVESKAFTVLSFGELYNCWLEQIEVGVITTHISEQDRSFYKPGEFLSDHNDLILETGAFLVGLSPQDRAALLLVYGEGFTYQQAGDILKVNESELTFSISQACTKLAGSDTFMPVIKDDQIDNKIVVEPQAAPLTSRVTPQQEKNIPKIFTPIPSSETSIEMDDEGTFISTTKVG